MKCVFIVLGTIGLGHNFTSFGHTAFPSNKYAKQLNFLFSTTTGNKEEAAPSLFLYFLWISSLWLLFNILSITNFGEFEQQETWNKESLLYNSHLFVNMSVSECVFFFFLTVCF